MILHMKKRMNLNEVIDLMNMDEDFSIANADFDDASRVIPWAVRNELDSTPQICVQFIIFA